MAVSHQVRVLVGKLVFTPVDLVFLLVGGGLLLLWTGFGPGLGAGSRGRTVKIGIFLD